MRDHEPVKLEEFNGFWARGDYDSCPLDHQTDIVNIMTQQGGFQTRDGIDLHENKQNIVRIYTFNTALDGYLALDNTGKIYHIIRSTSITQILNIVGMTDFKFVNVNNRALITPIGSGIGASFQFVYIYNGDGTTARKAAGTGPTTAEGALAAANSSTAGSVEIGYHVFGVVYETNSGFLSKIGPDTLPFVNAPGGKKVDLTAIPVGASSAVTKRHIVASKAVDPADWVGDTTGQQFFFVPGGTINNNTATTLTVDFFDSQLLEDASHLQDILTEIPSANHITLYHSRAVYCYKTATKSYCYVSAPGEPEAIDSVSGVISVDDNGLGILNAHPYRDVLYLFKINSTIAVNDNNSDPSSWPWAYIDEGVGAGLHGVCLVGVYEGGANVEYLISLDYNGIWVFDGVFRRPELSWKIADYWLGLTKTQISGNYEIYNDPQHQRLYISLTDIKTVLVGDYSNEFDFKTIKWQKWTWAEDINSITLFDKDNKLIIATNSYIYQVTVGRGKDTYASGDQKIPDPYIITAFIGNDESDDFQINHYTGIRIRVNGTGVLRSILYGFDQVRFTNLPNYTMGVSPGQMPFILTSFVTQRARLMLKTTAINEEMKVNRILIYMKEVFTGYPSVS